MKLPAIGVLLVLSFSAVGQHVKSPIRVGIAAGVNRQLLNTFQYASYRDGESIQAEGNLGFTASLYGQKELRDRLSVYLAPKFMHNRFNASLTQAIPEYAVVRHGWEVKQSVYAAALGVSYIVLRGTNKQLYLKAGLVNSLEYRTMRFTGAGFSFTSNTYNNMYTLLDYTPGKSPQWLAGSETGVGLRLYDGVDLFVGYTHNFTSSRVLAYTAEIGSERGASDVRPTAGELTSRNSYVSAEVIFWLNK
ncbi:hypothetical protein ACFPAF_21020 [Hymenobacter endophyticus]|uniref:Outer membrane protein beta-barrel domain-containing protein n=1 Tax=Hymenobacter endophyticus TaxID=3076335 RepID=A0ABU3TND0_9BACT|nr:hypothetical protein [Hymenobacter endophyticus]MDU0372893.1 hypothetical protein [Hymenobacter endophyticus]